MFENTHMKSECIVHTDYLERMSGCYHSDKGSGIKQPEAISTHICEWVCAELWRCKAHLYFAGTEIWRHCSTPIFA